MFRVASGIRNHLLVEELTTVFVQYRTTTFTLCNNKLLPLFYLRNECLCTQMPPQQTQAGVVRKKDEVDRKEL